MECCFGALPRRYKRRHIAPRGCEAEQAVHHSGVGALWLGVTERVGCRAIGKKLNLDGVLRDRSIHLMNDAANA